MRCNGGRRLGGVRVSGHHFPAAGLALDFGPLPTGIQGVKVVGCPSDSPLFTDDIGMVFQDGNAVTYRDGNGDNAEGDALLVDNTTGNALYEGKAHAWFGQNTNPNSDKGNQQTWTAQTISYHGSAPDGSSVTISASFGGGTSASGNESGWLHLKVTCS